MRTYSIMFRGWNPHIRASHTTTSDDGIGQMSNPYWMGPMAGNTTQLVAVVLTAVSPARQPRVRQVRYDRADFGLSEEMAHESI